MNSLSTQRLRSLQRLPLFGASAATMVDHTYTAKALAGLIALSRTGRVAEDSKVLFSHTGGQVGVLA
ncbi:MAG: hypothetical protein ABIR28_11500 [Vicinamibacteria bacterium]